MRNNKDLTKYVYSFTLGDGSVVKDPRDNGNASFEEGKTEKNLDFLDFISDALSPITSSKITLMSGSKGTVHEDVICGVKCTVQPMYRLRTSRHPFFNPFRERLYSTGNKIIDPHYLKLLDWEMLAILYQDDGSISHYISSSNKAYNTVELATHRYSYGDNLLLKKAIKETMDIEFNVCQVRRKDKLYYRLNLRQKDVSKFIDGISKFVLPSFEYKLNIFSNEVLQDENLDGDIV